MTSTAWKAAAITGWSLLILTIGIVVRYPSLLDSAQKPSPTLSERLDEVGLMWGLEWPVKTACSENAGLGNWAYNTHEDIETGFAQAGGWNIEIGEIELVRDRVAAWRDSYAEWVTTIEKTPDPADPECLYQVNTLKHRSRRALDNIDAILGN